MAQRRENAAGGRRAAQWHQLQYCPQLLLSSGFAAADSYAKSGSEIVLCSSPASSLAAEWLCSGRRGRRLSANKCRRRRSGVSSFQRTDPMGRSNMRRIRIGSGPIWNSLARRRAPQISSSANMVALVQTSLMLPVALVSTPAGAIADMFDRRIVGLVALSIVIVHAAPTPRTKMPRLDSRLARWRAQFRSRLWPG